MLEFLLCPSHGLPAYLAWILGGIDIRLFLLTFQTWCGKMRAVRLGE